MSEQRESNMNIGNFNNLLFNKNENSNDNLNNNNINFNINDDTYINENNNNKNLRNNSIIKDDFNLSFLFIFWFFNVIKENILKKNKLKELYQEYLKPNLKNIEIQL
jgi:hypothetical protein